MFENVLECLRMFETIPRCFMIFQELQGFPPKKVAQMSLILFIKIDDD